MRSSANWYGGVLGLCVLLCCVDGQAAPPLTAEQQEFFETRIRPVLVDKCYACHNTAELAEGGFVADEREAMLEGGNIGPVIIPGQPEKSRLLAILRHEVDGLKMPQGFGKLDARVIADFEKWIAMGAPDPRDAAPSLEELQQATSWPALLEKRRTWWSFQPVQSVTPPDLPANRWSNHPVDQFVFQKLEEARLVPNPLAPPEVLVRRLYFVLTGLPPTPDDLRQWVTKVSASEGYAELVDHLLASPQFGERWARHWMDWVRYAESHGSEGDPGIENAWYYRDYLIRALNQDVPYDQLLREHVAGDLLSEPRVNHELAINESAIGTAHWRMVFHGFAPTDALDEKVRFIDDQVNTFSKAFLGLTVSCARCHDHKFDPISQRDYYAMFGILSASRPARIAITLPDADVPRRQQLALLKERIRAELSTQWLEDIPELVDKLARPELAAQLKDQDFWAEWLTLQEKLNQGVAFAEAWQQVTSSHLSRRQLRGSVRQDERLLYASLGNPAEIAKWYQAEIGLEDSRPLPGQFAITTQGEQALAGIYPQGVYSHLISSKSPARLTSPDYPLPGEFELYLRVIGEGNASARFVVEDYPRDGTVFPVRRLANRWRWERFDLAYWNGDQIHIELAAAKDAPLLVAGDARSWFGLREAVILKKGSPPPVADEATVWDLMSGQMNDAESVSGSVQPSGSGRTNADAEVPVDQHAARQRLTTILVEAIQRWRDGQTSDADATLLDACLQAGLLANSLDQLGPVRELVAEYRRIEEELAVPVRVPALADTQGRQQPLYERGNHQQPADIVPPHFLEVIDHQTYDGSTPLRLQLADDLLRDDNPLTARVAVNRLWHHVFGRGLVGTPDNFGHLGQLPTHPELLDYLATQFRADGWSLKRLVRLLVMSETWKMSSIPSADARERDPDNQLLSHAFVRRLDAEAIRDALLATSGSLDPTRQGMPVDSGANRRSVYLRVIRNSLDPFLRAFDFPEPFSATGRRDVTNVPAQSLTLMNDAQVQRLAREWAGRVVIDGKQHGDAERISMMWQSALGRVPTDDEIRKAVTFLQTSRLRLTQQVARAAELKAKNSAIGDQRQAIVDPIRRRLQAEMQGQVAVSDIPQPAHRWEFDQDFQDSIGQAHGTPHGDVKLADGALVVSGDGHVLTGTVNQSLQAKTLEAWVQLDRLDQAGGGVLSVQSPNGETFDALVFGEHSPRHWLAGSNFFLRTKDLRGPVEQDAAERPVHLALVYTADGQIAAYRDGRPYGKAYASGTLQQYTAGNYVIGFGIRHLPAGGNRMLSGRIFRAQVYDRALTAEEIDLSFRSIPLVIPEAKIAEALSQEQRSELESLQISFERNEADLKALGAVPNSVDDQLVYTELARALFTFKEFIYLK